MKFLVVLDFDHTVVDDNTDTHIMKLGENGKIPENVESKYQKGHWTAFMNTVFEYLFTNCNVSKSRYELNLSEIPLTSGFLALFEFIRANDDVECIIISDSNCWFIDTILYKYQIQDIPLEIFTNKAKFVNGALRIAPHHCHDHESCPINMCKGKVLQQFLIVRRGQDIEYEHVFYVGDGGNDFCPARNLKSNDVLFARKDYALHKKLRKLSGNEVLSSKISIWENGMDILKVIEKDVKSS